MEYNDAGRLYQLFENGELISTYTYNAYGQRTRKVTADSTTVYHYDLSGQLISETQADMVYHLGIISGDQGVGVLDRRKQVVSVLDNAVTCGNRRMLVSLRTASNEVIDFNVGLSQQRDHTQSF